MRKVCTVACVVLAALNAFAWAIGAGPVSEPLWQKALDNIVLAVALNWAWD
jgi:hypothetical protein